MKHNIEPQPQLPNNFINTFTHEFPDTGKSFFEDPIEQAHREAREATRAQAAEADAQLSLRLNNRIPENPHQENSIIPNTPSEPDPQFKIAPDGSVVPVTQEGLDLLGMLMPGADPLDEFIVKDGKVEKF